MRLAGILRAAIRTEPYNFAMQENFHSFFIEPVLVKFFTDILGLESKIKDIEVIHRESQGPTTIHAKYILASGESNLAAVKCASMYANHLIATKDLESLLTNHDNDISRADYVVFTAQRSGQFSYYTDFSSTMPQIALSQELDIPTSLTVLDPLLWEEKHRDQDRHLFTPNDHWMDFLSNPEHQMEALMRIDPDLCKLAFGDVAPMGESAATGVNDSSIGHINFDQ